MKRLVVVGNGMAGMACLEQVLAYPPQFHVTVFGDETHVNYNRIMLSSVLAGETRGRRHRPSIRSSGISATESHCGSGFASWTSIRP